MVLSISGKYRNTMLQRNTNPSDTSFRPLYSEYIRQVLPGTGIRAPVDLVPAKVCDRRGNDQKSDQEMVGDPVKNSNSQGGGRGAVSPFFQECITREGRDGRR
jgi:hypothetical protein